MTESKDFKRQQIDLRKIVGIADRNAGRLGIPTPRGAIGGRRSIGYMNPDNTTAAPAATGQSGVKQLGTTKPADGVVKNGTTSKPASETGGNEVDPSDPSKSIYPRSGGGSGNVPMDTIMDSTTTLRDVEQYKSGTGGLTSAADGGGTLNAITDIYDCDEGPGTQLEIRTDGFARPPADWIDENTPSEDQRFVQGLQWIGIAGAGQFPGATALSAAEAARDADGSGAFTTLVDKTLDENFPHVGGTLRWVYTWSNGMTTVQYYAQDSACTPSEGDPNCPIEAPIIKWPPDGVMQMQFLNGRWTPNEHEPDEDLVQKYVDEQVSTMDFCFGDDRTGTLIPTANGGYAIAETSGGVPAGIIKLFGSNNRVVGYTDAAGLPSFLPEAPQPPAGGSFE